MTWNESLLADPSPWESAVEKTSADRWPLDWQLLRTLHTADEIPEEKLPILAWALSVDLWDTSWSVEKKRSVVRQSIKDHSLKGTIAGVRRYLQIVDSSLVMYLAPPQRTFASRTLTKEEFDAWLDTMPQLRIYLQSKPGDGRGLDFVGEGFADEAFSGFDAGAAIYGRFPVLVDNGVTTPLKTATVITTVEQREGTLIEQISRPGLGGFGFADVDFANAAYIDDELLAPEIYTISLDQQYAHAESSLSLNTAVPGLTPINVRFKRASEKGWGGPFAFVGDFASPAYFVGRDDGAWMLYDLLYLLDPERATPMVDAMSFADHSRVGMAPFTFEAMVNANDIAPVTPQFEGHFLGEAFARDDDLSKIDRAMDATAVSKGYRDKALMTFETTRQRTWGDGYPLDGSVPIWSRVNAAL